MKLCMVRLYPEQIAKHWALLAPLIESTLPPVSTPGNARSLRILEGLLSNALSMHQFYRQREDGSVEVVIFIITAVSLSLDGTGKDLFIYSGYGYEPQTYSTVIDCLKLIREYARGQGCNAVVALSRVPQVVDYFKRLGAQCDYTYIRLEV